MKAILVLVALGAAGCGVDCAPARVDEGPRATDAAPPPPTRTFGERGVVELSFLSSQCMAGCPLDREALEGGMIAVNLAKRGGGPATVRLEPPSLGTLNRAEWPCGDTACNALVEIETAASGEGWLEIVGPDGALVDRAKLRVGRAGALEIAVKVDGRDLSPLAGGVFAIAPGSTRVQIATTARGAGGDAMVFTKHGLEVSYDDTGVLKRDGKASGSGRTDVEDMIVEGAGDTTVTVRARGAEAPVRFRVGR